eukprot:symbB.v1.2.011185.t1/scaffold714.1/size170141/2
MNGDAENMMRLLQGGADVNWKRPKDGNTALHLAAEMGHTEAVQLLLASRADPEIHNDFALSPFALAQHDSAVEKLLAEVTKPLGEHPQLFHPTTVLTLDGQRFHPYLFEAPRFQVLSPEAEEEQEQDSPEAASSRGRRSAKRQRPTVATGAWSDPNVKPEREFVYYTDRQNWQEDAEIDTRRVQAPQQQTSSIRKLLMIGGIVHIRSYSQIVHLIVASQMLQAGNMVQPLARWQFRDMARWEEEKRKAKLREEENLMAERMRKEAFGEAGSWFPGSSAVTTCREFDFLVLAFIWSRALLGIPPRGRMPSLNAWLRRMPPRPKPLKPSLPKLPTAEGNEVPVSPLDTVQLRPATSLASIWEAYLFAGQFSTIPVALQLLEFPQAFLDWRRSDGLIPGLPNTPVAIDPIFSRKELPASEEDVVRACDEMLDSYGGILLAVIENGAQEELIGTLSVRVKWLPQACHTREDTEGHGPLVVRTVPYAQVSSAMGLEPVAYLEQFAVATEWRGSGLSARILHRAEDMARRWGLRILTLHVDDVEEQEAEMEDPLSEGEEEPIQPLPRKARFTMTTINMETVSMEMEGAMYDARVVPIILKTKSVSQFDMLMEEIDRVQEFAGLRIVIVHGGLGPEQIDIRRFNVFTELLEDLMERCGRINQKKAAQQYVESLRQRRKDG